MFELFERHATIVVAGAEALRGLLFEDVANEISAIVIENV